jgi:hypothetical protein
VRKYLQNEEALDILVGLIDRSSSIPLGSISPLPGGSNDDDNRNRSSQSSDNASPSNAALLLSLATLANLSVDCMSFVISSATLTNILLSGNVTLNRQHRVIESCFYP